MMVLHVLLVALLASGAVAQCNYYLEVAAGQTYEVSSPGYPNNYPGGVNCYWQAIAPSRSTLTLTCSDFNIESTENCQDGKFLVSQSGDETLSDAHTYCGAGTFTLESESNQMTMELITSYYSKGRFYCTITASEQETAPPPTCDCGWKNQARIVNGQETGVNEYPMMAGLVDYVIKELICGGTIISDRYILTAGHCLLNRKVNNTLVLVGDHNITTGDETDSAQLLLAESFQAHPDYDSVTQENDIAVVRVQRAIQFSIKVGPACLPFRFPTLATGTSCDFLGYGVTEQAGPKSDVLLKTSLNVAEDEFCSKTYGAKFNATKQICSYKNGTDACQSDSGGPVLWFGPTERLMSVGIISYGKGCATRYPGVNTKVYAYISWILDVTPDAQYCVR